MLESSTNHIINPTKKAFKHIEFKKSYQIQHNHHIRLNSHLKHYFLSNAPKKQRRRNLQIAPAENLGENFKKTQIFDHFHLRSQYDTEIFKMIGPCFLTNLALPLILTTDTAIAGHLGLYQISGIGIASALWMIISNILVSSSIIVAVNIARKKTEDNPDALSRSIAKYLTVAFGIGIILTLISLTCSQTIINIVKPSENIRKYALTYFRFMTLMGICQSLQICGAGVFRGLQDPMTVLKNTGLSVTLNIIISLVFVLKFNMGVSGIALGSTLSAAIASIVNVHKLITKNQLKIEHIADFPNFNFVKTYISQAMAISLRLTVLLGTIIIPSTILSRQNPVQHAIFEILRMTMFSFNVLTLSLDQANQVITAKYLQLNKNCTARAILNRMLSINFVVNLILASLLIIFSKPYVDFFIKDSQVINGYLKIVPFLAVTTPLFSFVALVDGAMIASKRLKFITKCQVISAILAILLMIRLNHLNVLNVFWSIFCIRLGGVAHGFISVFQIFFNKVSGFHPDSFKNELTKIN